MLKILPVDNYANGYSIEQLICTDVTIAGATGFYNQENYFYYCFYIMWFNNWAYLNDKHFDTIDNLTQKNVILKKLGLAMSFHEVTNGLELLSEIKTCLDNDIPVIINVKYGDLFYYPAFRLNKDDDLDHNILINGYNAERSIIILKEYVHVREAIRPVIKADLLCELPLTEDLLSSIWLKSNQKFERENSILHNNIYTIIKIDESGINNYNDLIADLISNCNYNCSSFSDFVDSFNDNIDNLKINTVMAERIKKNLCGTMVILFDVLEKSFTYLEQNSKVKTEFVNFKNEYCDFRTETLNKLYADALRGKRIKNTEKDSLIDRIRTKDMEMLLYVKKMNDIQKEIKKS